jgi:hypothetical protein
MRRFLRSLSAEKVESLSIAGQQERAGLIRALKEAEWFSNHHGGWAQPVELRVKLRSGEEEYFGVASYLREPGAVIDFESTEGRWGSN